MPVRKARRAEKSTLDDLCWRSKKHWGYDDDFMAKAGSKLEVKEALIEAGLVLVSYEDDQITGVAGLAPESDGVFDVSVFFIEPDCMGSGVGSTLFESLCALAREHKGRKLTILADPNAEGFYKHVGAIRVGEMRSSSATKRILPLLECEL